jgi:hypothetical protein
MRPTFALLVGLAVAAGAGCESKVVIPTGTLAEPTEKPALGPPPPPPPPPPNGGGPMTPPRSHRDGPGLAVPNRPKGRLL